MKKCIVSLGIIGALFFLTGKINAGTPLAQLGQTRSNAIIPPGTNPPVATAYSQSPTWNTVLSGNSIPASGAAATVTFSATQATTTFNGGVSNSTYTARNCITDITVQLSNGSTFYLLDGNTTSYVVYGAANIPFSGATSSTWNKHWDHLGPWCGTAGNAVTLSIPIPSVGTTTNAISADGYSVLTGLAAVYNIGQ